MTTEKCLNISELVENDKNCKNVVCPHCKSLILRAGVADFVEKEVSILISKMDADIFFQFLCFLGIRKLGSGT